MGGRGKGRAGYGGTRGVVRAQGASSGAGEGVAGLRRRRVRRSRLTDICRQAIAFDSPRDLLTCLQAVGHDEDVVVRRVKNLLAGRTRRGGYGGVPDGDGEPVHRDGGDAAGPTGRTCTCASCSSCCGSLRRSSPSRGTSATVCSATSAPSDAGRLLCRGVVAARRSVTDRTAPL